ncbi:hypothetical protein RF11_15591 [Thelohanellus kitauei]|uniref:Uncharacterized protein n=1 Tax=Thelohanellus kitauei TaxID=669202 RepID=A0A0C2MJJ7_THEKT|nr:hypothetical protein RF11_15591 [Thelohanellus kitauei]
MKNVFDSPEFTCCNVRVILIEKLNDSTSYFTHSCQIIHRNCLRLFMIHINKQGTGIDHITLKMLDPIKDCANNSNHYLRKRLLYVCGITSAATIAFYSIAILMRYLYLKKRNHHQRIIGGMVIKNSERYIVTPMQDNDTSPLGNDY